MDPYPEEFAILMLHDLIDEIFRPKDADSDVSDNETEVDFDLPEPSPDTTPEVAPVPPKSSSIPAIPISSRPRYRLGVNAGAHEQIVRLRSTLEVVSKERNYWRDLAREKDAKIHRMDQEMGRLEARMMKQVNLLRFYRSKVISDQGDSAAPQPKKPKQVDVLERES